MKVLFGFFFWWIYEYYYDEKTTSDAFRFFDDGLILYDALKTNPLHYLQMITGIYKPSADFDYYFYQMNNWYKPYEDSFYNDNRTIIRLNGFWAIFSFGNYHVHTVFAAFISLIGSLGIFSFVKTHFSNNQRYLLYLSVLFPSVIFWSSGVLKECYLFFILGISLFFFSKIINEKFQIKNFVFLLVSLFFLVWIKIYVIICLIPCLIVYYINHHQNNHKTWQVYSVFFSALFLLFLGIIFIFPEIEIIEKIVRKQNDFINMAEAYGAGSMFEMQRLDNNLISLVKNIPNALYNVFFRPSIFDLNKLIVAPAFLENIFVFILYGVSFFYLQKKLQKKELNFLFFTIAFILMLGTIIGLTTPVVGAIVRYRIIFYPFLLILPFVYSNINQILIKLKK